MKFYFNYFLLIGREHINCLLSTVYCLHRLVMASHQIQHGTQMLSAPRVVVYAVVVAYLITVFLPLTHLLLATREAQFSSAHSRPIAKDFVDGKRSFYNNFDIRLSCSRSA